MAESTAPAAARTADAWRHLWRFTLDPFATRRRPTREVRVGDVGIGGGNPVRVQSMTVADTLDTAAVVAEIEVLAAAGSEIVRVTAPNRSAAENLAAIRAALRRRGVQVPLVADIHFTPQAAFIAAQYVEKVRINPGNYADRKHFEKWEYTDAEYAAELERLEAAFRPLVLRCKELGVAMRIGTNHGSLSDRILNRYGDTPLGMVESALEFVRICEHHGYRDIVLSMKASDVKVMVQANRLLAARLGDLGLDYPFHLGVTEAGAGFAARVKSAVGIAALLLDGIGDTVRVSLAEDSVHEIPVARALARRSASSTGAARSGAQAPPLDPYRFQRRPCASLGAGTAQLAAHHPPRIELVVRLADDPQQALAAARAACAPEPGTEGADCVLLALDASTSDDRARRVLWTLAPWAASRGAAAPAAGLELAWRRAEDPAVLPLLAPWARISLRLSPAEVHALALPAALPPIQYTLAVEGAQDAAAGAAALAARIAAGHLPPGALALATRVAALAPHCVRRLLGAAGNLPIVLRGPEASLGERIDDHLSATELDLAASCGALLVDGVGDALQLHATPDAPSALRLAQEILQTTRLRLHQADFIACPSCGRTQFDLQSITAAIASRLRHLKGLKIAVMGCIVNGPGEMADADFGYVGSGPGKIDLYVGHERVERNLPESEAVERLVDLIRSRGAWQDPPGGDRAPEA
jgi:(E)-4-hydroxy-3-methylbut-2-enyl-diphosphate synthase